MGVQCAYVTPPGSIRGRSINTIPAAILTLRKRQKMGMNEVQREFILGVCQDDKCQNAGMSMSGGMSNPTRGVLDIQITELCYFNTLARPSSPVMRLLPFSLSLLCLLQLVSTAPVPETNKVARYYVFEPRDTEKDQWKRAASVWPRDINAASTSPDWRSHSA
ncbi:hypothetical protein AX14_005751 [Amanita brunnescens Koide BX004]|nr:hypothetical protein AX14_005751 [Amanita brunnescens Koide BX004]